MYTYVDTNLQHFAILFTYCVSFLPYNNRYVQERGPKSPLKPISRRKGDGACLYFTARCKVVEPSGRGSGEESVRRTRFSRDAIQKFARYSLCARAQLVVQRKREEPARRGPEIMGGGGEVHRREEKKKKRDVIGE